MERVMKGANDIYRERLAEVGELIETLGRQLTIHERRQRARPGDWGFVGDLGAIADRLREIDLLRESGHRLCAGRGRDGVFQFRPEGRN
jgi:hypothetical protein